MASVRCRPLLLAAGNQAQFLGVFMVASSDGIMKHMSCILILSLIDDVVGYRRQVAEIVLAILGVIVGRGLGWQLPWWAA